MSIDKLESEKRDDLCHLNDDDLAVVTGGVSPNQIVLCEGFLMTAKACNALMEQQECALNALRKHFPPGYRVVPPGGGYFLWIELPPDVDSLEIHRRALESRISIAPGPIFSARREFKNYIRLNCGHPWTPKLDQAMARLGAIVRELQT